jgi:hypothetical protein
VAGYLDGFFKAINTIRAAGALVTGPPSSGAANNAQALNFLAPFTVAFNSATGADDIGLSSSPSLSGGLSLGTGTPPPIAYTPGSTLQTNAGTSSQTLVTYTVPNGRFTVLVVNVYAWLPTSTTGFIYTNTGTATITQSGSAAATKSPVNAPGNPFSNSSPAAPFAASGSPGGIGFALTGSVVTLTATGLSTPGAWAAGNFTVGQLVAKSGNVYGVISISGTGTSTTGPSGTGTTTDNAGGNQVIWDYIGPSSGGVPINWAANLTTIFTV